MAQLTYELLGAEKRKSCAVKRRFKPVNALGNAGNSILYDGLQRSSLFESSESFFHKLESEIRSGGGESRALPAPASNPREHSAASSRTNDIIRRFNRDADWLAALVLGAVVSAALVLAVLVQDRRPKAVDLTEKAVQAGGDLLLNANSAMVLKNVGLKGKESTGEITSGQASSADHPLTEISPKENPSSPIQAAASVPTPVFAITSELNHINAADRQKCVITDNLARFCASDPTKDPHCKIQVLSGAQNRGRENAIDRALASKFGAK